MIHFYRSPVRVLCGLALAAVTFTLIASTGADAVQRKVLFEDFSSTTCPPCAALAPTQEQALGDCGPNVVKLVTYHMNWPAPGDDPWYADNPADENGRRGYYAVNGVPTIYLDGAVCNARTRQTIAAAINQRYRVDAPASLAITARISGGTLNATVTVRAESAITSRLYVAVVEQQYHFVPRNFPNWQEHYGAMIKMLPNSGGSVANLGAGQSNDFDLQVSMDGVGWHDLDIENLEVVAWLQEANKNVLQTESFELGTDTPNISILDWTLSDVAEGNGDGRAEPGETAHLDFTIENAPNYLPADLVTIEVTTNDQSIEMVDGMFRLEGLNNGDRANTLDDPIRFRVADDFVPHPVTFFVSVQAQPGEVVVNDELSFMVGWPEFLLIDASNNGPAGASMTSLFGFGAIPWCDRWDRAELGVVPEELLPHYDAIIWHSYNNTDAINEYEAELLVSYLEHGGHLILAGSHITDAIYAHPLLRRYMGIQIDNAETGENYVTGMTDNSTFNGCRVFLGGGGFEMPNGKPSFTALNGATGVLHYGDGANNVGLAGVERLTRTYATLALAFPIECVNGAARTETRVNFVNRLAQWVNSHPVSVGAEPVAPLSFVMNPAYPNPFNPGTVLSFTLPATQLASLQVFDVAGRNVATLLNGTVAAGVHSVTFDASDFGLGAGIYYARLETAGKVESTKLLYLK